MDIVRLLKELNAKGALRDSDEVHQETVSAIQPEYADENSARDILQVLGAATEGKISRLYRHQADAINTSASGRNVVLSAPTASGKTLAFTASMLKSGLLAGKTALVVYPMKAVARDQKLQIDKFCGPLGVKCAVYDGSTSEKEKQAIKSDLPPVLLTNPEYIHFSFLQWSRKWDDFLNRLSFVVFDEAHEYRGYFGSNMALLIRRLLAKAEMLGAHPRVFMATATCKNPKEHAEALTGRQFELISAEQNAMRPERHYVFANHDVPDFKFWRKLQQRIVNAVMAWLNLGRESPSRNSSALVFCPSIKFAAETHVEAVRKAKEQGLDAEKIAVFYADLPTAEKNRVQDGLKSGALSAVFCTNALEMGIDIGGLDGVILAGFPDNIASARQRLGRAGRSLEESAFVLYYPMNNPLDRFYAANLQAFLDNALDPIVLDPQNEVAVKKHAPFLSYEMGYEIDDSHRKFLGERFFTASRRISEQGVPVRGYTPNYMGMNMRASFGGGCVLVANNEEIGTISNSRKFREAYLGAVLAHNGKIYRVESHEEGKVFLAVEERNVRSAPLFDTNIDIGDSQFFSGKKYQAGRRALELAYRSLNIGERLLSYRLIENGSDKVLDQSNDTAKKYYNNHYAFVMSISGVDEADRISVKALEHIMRVGAIFVVPADRHDTSTYSSLVWNEVYLYENLPGGIGVAKSVFADWVSVIETGVKIAENCSNKKCKKGCPNCIMPPRSADEIDKIRGIALAKAILGIIQNPECEKFAMDDGQWVKCDD